MPEFGLIYASNECPQHMFSLKNKNISGFWTEFLDSGLIIN